MSIIIRLQNLPLEANSLDIRRFFNGLQIPDGGVHIVGGEKGDAFIAFGSDEDARQAMERDGEMVKDCRCKLLLSSRNEMQRVIEQARNQSLSLKSAHDPPPVPAVNYMVSNHLASSAVTDVHKVDDMRLRGRSPDRRQTRQRSMERERMRIRSRSRSPFRKDINGNSGLIDKIGSLQANMINPMNVRDSIGNTSFSSQVPSVRSRLGYSEVIPPSGIQDIDRSLPRSNQWLLRNEPSYDTRRQSGPLESNRIVIGAGDFRDHERFQSSTSHLIPNQTIGIAPERNYTVELRNLPFNIIPRDLMEFFHGLYVSEENIKILIDDRGLTTGGALVRFTNDREFDIALSLNGKFLGGRRITLQPLLEPLPVERPLERNDMTLLRQQSALQSNSLSLNTPLITRDSGPQNYILYMKGLPFNQCTERDVANFFEGIRITDIVIECDPRGKPLGNAFVEFETARDFEAAQQLNMKHMGRRYIELLSSTKEDMIEARRIYSDDQSNNNEIKGTFCVNINNLPPTVTNRDLTTYFVEFGAQPYAIHIMLKPNGLNAGEAYVEFATIEHQYAALRRDGTYMGQNRIVVKAVPFELMRNVVGKPPNNSNNERNSLPPRHSKGTRGEDNGRMPFRARERDERGSRAARADADPFADGRCVIIASNIPYRASTDDICVFFSDYGITEQCVSRRFNEKGQPTADARIAFRTPEDAARAIRMMHKKFLIGRPVLLRSAN